MHSSSIHPTSIDKLREAVSAITPMADGDFDMLLPFLKTKAVAKGKLILRENEVCRHIFFLCEGFVRMYYLDFEGNDINYRFTESGHFFVDFQSFLTQQPSRYYWEAMQDSELLFISYSSVQHIYQSSAEWNYFGRLMAEHVYLQLNERVEMLMFMKPEERYKFIAETKPELLRQVSLFHLSSYIGIKPESLSRIRKRLAGK